MVALGNNTFNKYQLKYLEQFTPNKVVGGLEVRIKWPPKLGQRVRFNFEGLVVQNSLGQTADSLLFCAIPLDGDIYWLTEEQYAFFMRLRYEKLRLTTLRVSLALALIGALTTIIAFGLMYFR